MRDGRRLATGAALLLLAVLVVRYQARLAHFIEWGDESETIVAARMMAAGMKLYSEIFNHHGPLTFLSGYLIELAGNAGVPAHRAPIFVLQWAALAALHFSPVLRDPLVRLLYTGGAALVMLLHLPEPMLGHTYQYQVLAGLLFVIVLAQYTLPAIMRPETVGPARVAVGNFLIACLPFLAITYAPLAAALFLVSLRMGFLRRALAFAAGAAAANLLFLAVTGSFAGYLAFHLYLNSSVLAQYDGGHDIARFAREAYLAMMGSLPGFLAFAVVVASGAAIAARERGIAPWRSALLALAMASLLIRGGHPLQQLVFYYGLLALPLALFAGIERLGWRPAIFGIALLLAGLARLSLLPLEEVARLASRPIREATEFGELARAITSPEERIIAYTFQNHEYLAAGRLPASGHFFYLPWQEKYNESPRYGIRIDACEQIRAARPKVMLLDKGTVWGRYPWESYARCVQSLVDAGYYQVPGKPFYVRNDLAPAALGLAAPGETHALAPTPPLAPGAPLALATTAMHRADPRALKSVGLLFGTHARVNAGEAELEMSEPEGRTARVRFTLHDLADNRYRFFELPPGRYAHGRIAAAAGGGVSAWESRGANATATCLVYVYADGNRRFTPGCPLH